MSEGTIDELVIEVSSNASSSVDGIHKLSSALSELDISVSRSVKKLNNIASSTAQLKTVVSGLSFGNLENLNGFRINKSTANNLSSIANTLSTLPSDTTARLSPLYTLSNLSNVKISSTIPNNIRKISEAILTLPVDASTRLAGVSNALLPLKDLSGLRLTTVINTLKQLPDVLKNYETLNVSALVQQLDQLTPRLSSLAASVNTLKNAYTGMPTSLKTAAASARTVASANKTLDSSNKTLKSSFMGVIAKVGVLSVAFNKLWSVASKCVNETNSYIENMNLFEASMGSATSSALNYAQTVQDAMGIDIGEWARNQGVFQTLITGMGETAENANIMSQQLTQLGYDIASFYNISTNDAMLKIQSGIAGELEPLRRIGWDLSDARMQLELTNLGIDKNTQSMTQAEKVALRYYLIMNQVTITHGDMARTISSPANQLRVLQAQVTLAARSLGNLFIPVLNAVLPYLIGVAKAVRILAIEIANLFGIDATFEVDYSTLDTSGITTGITDTTDALEDAGSAASDADDKVKELKRSLMGFDEINNITSSSDTSSSGSGSSGAGVGGGSGLDLPLDTYDFLAGLDNTISELTDNIGKGLANGFKQALPWVSAIGLGIGAWKIADMLMNIGKLTIALNPVATIIGVVAGLTALGAAGLYDMWKNGQNWANSMQVAVSSLGLEGISIGLQKAAKWASEFVGVFKEGSLAASIAGAFEKFGPALKVLGKFAGVVGVIFSVVDAVLSVGNVFDSITSGEPIAEASLFSLSTSALGIGMMFGPYGAIAGAIIGGVIFIAGEIYNHWDEICSFFAGIPAWFDTNVCQPVASFFSGIGESIATFFTDAWNSVVNTWNTIGAWFNDNVVAPIQSVITPFVEWFSQLFSNVGQTISDVFYNAGAIAQGCVQTIQLVWGVITEWFSTTIIQPVSEFFTGLWATITQSASDTWNAISATWSVVSEWFNITIIQPVQEVFTNLWSTVTGLAGDTWNIITGIFGNLANWFGSTFSAAWAMVQEVFSTGGEIFQGITEGISETFVSIVNSLISGINTVVSIPFNAINSVLGVIRSFSIAGVRPFGRLVNISVPSIPYLAEGGQVTSGQLFVARENGQPELVGQMGGKTTVANNEQIIQGIASGVASAMSEQNRILNEQNSLLRQILSKETGITLDGRSIAKSINNAQRVAGKQLIEVW